MKYIVLVCTIFLSLVIKPATKADVTDCGQNIVFIIVDDLGYADYSAEFMPLTHQLFADKGTKLNLYSHQNCVPSRAALMTGLNPARVNQHGVFAPPINPGIPAETILLPEFLQKAGYTTGAFGKWHIGWHNDQIPTENGFDEFVGILSGHIQSYGSQDNAKAYADGTVGHDHHGSHDMTFNGVPFYTSRYSTHLFRDATVNFIDSASRKDAPFFAYVAFNAPHSPYHAPRSSFDSIKSAFGVTAEDETYIADYADDVIGLPKGSNAPTDVQQRVNRAMYYAMVTELDNAIYDVWQAVADSGHADDTMFVFTSDNGGVRGIADNAPLRGGKGSPFEGGHFVANGIIAPCIDAGQSVDTNVWFADLMPTFLEVAGIEGYEFDGASAVGSFSDNSDIWRMRTEPMDAQSSRSEMAVTRSFPSHIDKRYRANTGLVHASVAITFGDYKYVRYVTFDESGTEIISTIEHLFDLSVSEYKNVINDARYASLADTAVRSYDYWLGDTALAALDTIDSRGAWTGFEIPTEWNQTESVIVSQYLP